MDKRKIVGNQGETFVCHFLEERGHRILERNCRCGHLELDIVSMAADGIHFVEVKSRRPPLQAMPQDSITVTKRKRIARAAVRFLASDKNRDLAFMECHFDVAAVVFGEKNMRIDYISDAFIPIYM